MTDDRTKQQPAYSDIPDGGLGDDLRGFLAKPVQSEPGRRARSSLQPSFRPAPGPASNADPGFPGTRSFSSRRSYSRAAGSTLQPEAAGRNLSPAHSAGADGPARRRTALSRVAAGAAAERAGQSADAGSGGGRVRGRFGRPPGSGKAKDPSASKLDLPRAIAKLVAKEEAQPASAPTKGHLVPTESERADARRLFREIGERFNENRKKSKTAAYAAYRHDLMANLDTLIMGGAIDLKEATTIITNLEQYTKETEQESTDTPATLLGKWLRMDPAEMVELEKPAVVEEEGEEAEEEGSGEEVDELDSAADPTDDGDGKAVT